MQWESERLFLHARREVDGTQTFRSNWSITQES